MNMSRRRFVGGTGAVVATLLSACGNQGSQGQGSGQVTDGASSALALDPTAWSYDADNDVYYQLGISYCENPADESYEQLAVLVPGAYLSATDNGDETFTCEVDASGTVGGYTAATAPIVMPVNTPGYAAQAPMESYSAQTSYTDAGIVYVHAGCRGRDTGAPAGVVDLKAAVRFLRLVSSQLAGSTDRIFTFGMSGGGAQSALMGATGDSELYKPYLEAIGAADGVSDAVAGSMCWCPITGLDVADGAYEWMMGPTRSGLTSDEQAISDGLAEAFAEWINGAGIVDSDGAVLALEASSEGIYQSGSYYDLVLETIEGSLNNFLADTEFPYDASLAANMGGGPGGGFGGPGGGFGGPGGGGPGGDAGQGAREGLSAGERPSGKGHSGGERDADGSPGDMGDDTERGAEGDFFADGASDADGGMADAEQLDDISRTETTGGVTISGTYETPADYIAALNADGEWVSYDESTNTARITSVTDFCVALKQASKSLGAFDQLDRGQGENTLFGEDGSPSHFDAMMTGVLEDLDSSYAADYADDLERTDALGTGVVERVSMYTPLYYLLESQDGYGASTPATYWRIRTGIEQGDTALATELNLALALRVDTRVESVDFATVWGMGHTQAERTGSADENFIAWVADCLA